jgi:tRNA-binding protein
MQITIDDFKKVDIRVGTIIRTELFPTAKKSAIKIWIEFRPEIGEKETSAQITSQYDYKILTGRQIAAVVNFPPRQIGNFISEVLLLGFPNINSDVVLIRPDKPVPNGGKLY